MSKVQESYEAHTKKINASGEIISAEINYIVFDAESEDEALSAVLEFAPSRQGESVLSSIEIESKENDVTFKVRAIYDLSEDTSSFSDDDTDEESTMSFDCGGGTKHVTHSISQRNVKGNLDAGGAVGWNGKFGNEMEISGVDIPTAQLRETYTKQIRISNLTTAYKRKVASLVGKINSSSFKGWDRGEVMFLGISYSSPIKNAEKVTVTFNFSIQPNEKENISGVEIEKKGWEYVWAIQGAKADKVPMLEAENIYVDQVCEYGNFSELGL